MRIEEAKEIHARIVEQPKKRLIGIDRTIKDFVDAIFVRVPHSRHERKALGQASVFFYSIPGMGKTDLADSIGCTIGASSQLIPGDPSNMSKDIVGHEILDPTGEIILEKGPIFNHIVVSDEINRNHPKGQASLLQAMEERVAIIKRSDREHKVSYLEKFPLLPIVGDPKERMFHWFIATANPLEQEGTYVIPEALLDRFTLSFRIDYPVREDEKQIRAGNVMFEKDGKPKIIEQITTMSQVLDISELIFETTERLRDQSERANDYIQRLVENSRPHIRVRDSAKKQLCELVDTYVKCGLSPRSNFHFEAAARTHAFFHGNGRYITVDDVKAVAMSIMRHRVQLQGTARGADVTAEKVVSEILEHTEAP